MAQLPTLKNAYDNRVITINNSTFSIGRSLSCDHIINSIDVSRFHCVIKRTNDKWVLYDRSSNGTVVNSTLIKFNDNVDLHNGDSIRLGVDESLCFIFNESTAKPETLESNRSTVPSAFRPEEQEFEDAAVLLADTLLQPRFNFNSTFSKEEELPIDLSTAAGDATTNALTQLTRDFAAPVSISEEVVVSTKVEEKSKSKVEDCTEAVAQDVPTVKKEPESALNLENEVNSEMENELTCSICSEFFIKAVTLNCSHTFCKYCIEQWKKNKPNCPICRNLIVSTAPTLVVDNVIEKTLKKQSEEVNQVRRELIKQREEASKGIPGSSSSSNYLDQEEDDDLDDSVIEINSDIDDYTEEYDSDVDDFDYYDHDYFDFPPPTRRHSSTDRATPYFGGYGRCYICNEEGHWANGCPNRRR